MRDAYRVFRIAQNVKRDVLLPCLLLLDPNAPNLAEHPPLGAPERIGPRR